MEDRRSPKTCRTTSGSPSEPSSAAPASASQWDAGFVHPISERHHQQAATRTGPVGGARRAPARYNGDDCQRIIYTESHDEVANGHERVPEEIWPGNAGSWFSRKRSTLGAALVFTAPGIPMIFQGQEFLEDEYFRDSEPLDWSKLKTYAGIQLLYRDLIRLRRNWFDQTRGLRGQQLNVHHINNSDKLLAFHRWERGGAGDDVVVVANFANRAYDLHSWFSATGFLACPFQQRLARLQRRFRESARL